MDLNNLTLYNCSEIIQQIENLADAQDGAITDEQMEVLVRAQTTSLAKLEKLANYVIHLELFQDMAKQEIDRLYQRKVTAEKRVESIKQFLLPYIKEHGPVNFGLHKIANKPSKRVETDPGFCNPQYERIPPPTGFVPDKVKIRKDIDNGIAIQGARLVPKDNLQIK
jgi:hypothetical protein